MWALKLERTHFPTASGALATYIITQLILVMVYRNLPSCIRSFRDHDLPRLNLDLQAWSLQYNGFQSTDSNWRQRKHHTS